MLSYEIASGQVVNYQKSNILFSANMIDSVRDDISSLLGVNQTLNQGKYLGLPSLIGRSKREVLGFIKDRVWQKLQGWQNKFLNRAVKEILLKTVAQAVPNFAMNVFLFPKRMCKEIERMMNGFWWRGQGSNAKGIRWFSWDHLSFSKQGGGLGFKKLWEFNLTILSKQAWRFLTFSNLLVSHFFKAKYFPSTSFLNSNLGYNPSFV